MDPLTIAAIANGLAALVEIYRINSNKPKGWEPSGEEILALLQLADKSADDYKREAAARLGVPWPPVA